MKRGGYILVAAAAAVMLTAFAGCKRHADISWREISTAAQLDSVKYNLSGNYKLMADISLADYDNWKPIGTNSAPFTGRFNGNGHKITDLSINRSEMYVGLFGFIHSGSVSNLGVEIASGGITGDWWAGGIAGDLSWGSTITNCYSTGNITSSSSDIWTSGNGGCSGGIAGLVENRSTITNCYSSGNISYNGGGIAGRICIGTITNCYSAGNITSDGGGIVGEVQDSNSKVTNCAAINPTINNRSYKGRIVAYIWDGTTPTISNNFALDVIAGKFNTTDTRYYGVSKTREELQTQSTYSDPPTADGKGGLGWKFGNDDDNPWKMPAGGGYPILYWQ